MAEKGESINIWKEMIDLTLIISEAASECEISDDEKEVFTKRFTKTLAKSNRCVVYPLMSKFGK